ncbi:alpha/beta fold hydrolase [Aquabacter spiritensis]|uniref:Pimeloyl-ACP methyl ester carboxylesterase n=1 Tax=Aquabacter spiritensis TaxID=933073 RepID=A0A4R3LQI8_9HYPH|nr:alpha/beta hydrolase [Aquabacter spiritensis]TCT02650.1 pimeloyl-ACP methyl ester carboxylesterase [Aquabacter spiritensis]
MSERGDPTGRPVLFIHGYAQSALSWQAQLADESLGLCRLVAYDLRGHGASDKPREASFYGEAQRWAGEVRAILDQGGLHRPVLVGWSYGGRIIADYLAAFGDADLSGLVFVDAVTSNARHFYGAWNRAMRLMGEPDPATMIAATRAFQRACFHVQPAPDLFETLLAAAMMCPADVRAAMARAADYDAVLARIHVPSLIMHGAEDAVIALSMAKHIAGLVPNGRLAVLSGVGHAPFIETPAAFNALLAGFLDDLA